MATEMANRKSVLSEVSRKIPVAPAAKVLGDAEKLEFFEKFRNSPTLSMFAVADELKIPRSVLVDTCTLDKNFEAMIFNIHRVQLIELRSELLAGAISRSRDEDPKNGKLALDIYRVIQNDMPKAADDVKVVDAEYEDTSGVDSMFNGESPFTEDD